MHYIICRLGNSKNLKLLVDIIFNINLKLSLQHWSPLTSNKSKFGTAVVSLAAKFKLVGHGPWTDSTLAWSDDNAHFKFISKLYITHNITLHITPFFGGEGQLTPGNSWWPLAIYRIIKLRTESNLFARHQHLKDHGIISMHLQGRSGMSVHVFLGRELFIKPFSYSMF